MRLTGRVVIVPAGADPEALVVRLAAEGATIVLVDGGDGGGETGRLASRVESAGGRPAVFQATDMDGLVEFLDEVMAQR